MTKKEQGWLVLSVVLSIAIWGLVYGFLAGAAFTLSLLFHEYGHYYWMGREGIRDKTMIMIPPFGAIAMTKQPWPSLGAEARIALAGPGFGLISALVLLLIGWLSVSYAVKISVFGVCFVNLFNLCMPIAVLDGGRVIKPILFSLNTKAGMAFYVFSFVVLFAAVAKFFSLFTVIIGFIIFKILESDFFLTKHLIDSGGLIKMSKKEMRLSAALFLLIASGLYAVMLVNNISYNDFIRFVIGK